MKRPPSFLIYVLLVLGAGVFSIPFAWMVSTSLKPIEQTMTVPATWIPRSFTATINGQRMDVTRDFEITQPSALVTLTTGPSAGKRIIVAQGQARDGFIPGGEGAPPQAIHFEREIKPGEWHVTERSATSIRDHTLAWDVVPAAEIETRIDPLWSNYSKALATIGGASINAAEGTERQVRVQTSEDSNVPFWRFLLNTLIVCVLSVIGAVLSNAVVAYGLTRIPWRGRNILFAITMATMMVPFPVLMVPLFGVFRSLHLVGTLVPLWLPTFFGGAFNIFLLRQFFRTIPEELSEAARIDGCSEWQIFWMVILPLCRPALAVVALFQFLHAWNDLLGPTLYLTRRHTYTLSLALQSYQSQAGGVQWNYLMAASTVVVLPIIVLFFFTQKTFVSGIATSGLKG